MCLRRAPEKYIAGAALDRADLGNPGTGDVCLQAQSRLPTILEVWKCGSEVLSILPLYSHVW
jgi:hypothetical protein